jgi:hypothetical protein
MATPRPTNEAFINEAYDSRFTRVKKEVSYQRRHRARRDTSIPSNTQIRKIQTATMYEEPRIDSSYKNELQDTASTFNDTYAEKGIQPTYKTNIEKKATQKKDRTAVETSQNIRRVTKRSGVIGAVAKKVPLVRVASIATKIGRKKTKVVNRFLIPAGMGLWSIQWPIAFVSIGALGLATAAEIVKSSSEGSSTASKILDFAIATNPILISSTLISKGAEQAGIDLPSLGDIPLQIFIALTMLVFFIGVVTLILINISYIATGTKPFSGEGQSLKIGALVFALMGYMIPFLNMIPWFIVWTWAVGRYPD